MPIAAPLLLPIPRELRLANTVPRPRGRLVLHGLDARHRAAAQALVEQLRAAGGDWSLAAEGSAPQAGDLVATLGPATGHAQGYTLELPADAGPQLTGDDAAGLFYGLATLGQLVRQYGLAWPTGTIRDWPDFAQRGVMLDVSRDKVPTLATLELLVAKLAGWKLNHLQLYLEHTFAYQNHGEVWAQASPYTAADIARLEAVCQAHFIELVPNQNGFGHTERWLRHARYRHLAECPDGYTTRAGEHRPPSTLAPRAAGTWELLAELYGELLPNFSSRRVHIGGDETWELGQGRSRDLLASEGLHGLYLGWLRQMRALPALAGRELHYWGDMVWNHFPERLAELPRDLVQVDWGYYRAYPFAEHGAKLAAAGLPFWFAPGTSTWCTLLGCNEAGLGSNRSSAQAGLRHGAAGLLNTDWGDRGHWQTLPVSYLPLAAGAACAWHEAGNSDTQIIAALDTQVFADPAGVLGGCAKALADTWSLVAENCTQANYLDRLLRGGLQQEIPAGITVATLDATLAHLAEQETALARARPTAADGALVCDEFRHGLRMARHACTLGRLLRLGQAESATARASLADDLAAIIAEHQRLWLARNRSGGLNDSLSVLRQRLADYQAGERAGASPAAAGSA